MNVDAVRVRDVEIYEEVFSDGLGTSEGGAVQPGRLFGEPSLRRADADAVSGEVRLEDAGETVDDVSFGHCTIPADPGYPRR